MKAAITFLGGGDKKTLQPGDEIPDGYFSDEELESAKAAGAIEGEGPNAEDEGPNLGPTPAQETAETQAAEKLSPPAAAKAEAAKAEAKKAEEAK